MTLSRADWIDECRKNFQIDPDLFLPGAKPDVMSKLPVALSIKQPWAALIVAGLKRVEVRTWSTRRRGRLLIHTGRVADRRPEGWALIDSPGLEQLAALRGGVLGEVELSDCILYGNAREFAAAEADHRNRPEWFRPGGLHGFVFHHPRPIAYHACPGHTLFFAVEGITLS